MNQNDNKYFPFVSCLQININSQKYFNQFEYDVEVKDNRPFLIKKNALVIVENKLKFPSQKDKIVELIKIMVKKLNFMIKLIKNTTKYFYSYDNIQLLLIYDDAILISIPFNESTKFSVEIIYISQTVNIYNTSKVFDEINKMEAKIKKSEKILHEYGWLNEEK